MDLEEAMNHSYMSKDVDVVQFNIHSRNKMADDDKDYTE
jgi:hypothetical protein